MARSLHNGRIVSVYIRCTAVLRTLWGAFSCLSEIACSLCFIYIYMYGDSECCIYTYTYSIYIEICTPRNICEAVYEFSIYIIVQYNVRSYLYSIQYNAVCCIYIERVLQIYILIFHLYMYNTACLLICICFHIEEYLCIIRITLCNGNRQSYIELQMVFIYICTVRYIKVHYTPSSYIEQQQQQQQQQLAESSLY